MRIVLLVIGGNIGVDHSFYNFFFFWGGGVTAFPICKEQIEFFFVVPCSAGTFLDPMKSTCTDCPVGTYKEIPENVDCTPCPSGKSTETTGSRNITSCLSKNNLITTVESFKFLGTCS